MKNQAKVDCLRQGGKPDRWYVSIQGYYNTPYDNHQSYGYVRDDLTVHRQMDTGDGYMGGRYFYNEFEAIRFLTDSDEHRVFSKEGTKKLYQAMKAYYEDQ